MSGRSGAMPVLATVGRDRGTRPTASQMVTTCRRAVPWIDWRIEGDLVVGKGRITVCVVEAGREGPTVRSVTLRRPLAWPVDEEPVSGPAIRGLRGRLQRLFAGVPGPVGRPSAVRAVPVISSTPPADRHQHATIGAVEEVAAVR